MHRVNFRWQPLASEVSTELSFKLFTFLLFRPATVPPPDIPVFPLFLLPDNPGVDPPHDLVLLLGLSLGLAHTQPGPALALEGIETQSDTSPPRQAGSRLFGQI